jgi:hypothetical protein
MKIEQSLRLPPGKRLCCAFQPKVDIRTQDHGRRGAGAPARRRGVIQAPSTFINLATELGDELTIWCCGIVKSIDLTTRFRLRHAISIASRQTGRQSRPCGRSQERSRPVSARFMIEVEDAASPRCFSGRDPADLPQARRQDLDRRFRHRLSLSALVDITPTIKIDRLTDIHKRPRSRGYLAGDRS